MLFRPSTLAAAGMIAGLAAVSGPAAAGQTSLGFAVSWFMPAMYHSDADCAGGPNEELNWEALLRKSGLHPEKRLRELFDDPKNQGKLLDAIAHRGKGGANVCYDPNSDFVSPDWKAVTGKTAIGINLDGTNDGRETATTCRHEKFQGKDGTPAIDNQYYRILGCSKGHRGEGKTGFSPSYIIQRMKEGMITFLIEVTGVDDLQNDPEVQLGFYKGLDPLKMDAAGNVLAHSTFRIVAETSQRVVMKGAIKDGVLTTQPADFSMIVLPLWQPEWNFSGARFTLKIAEDGTLTGTMAGYQDWVPVYWSLIRNTPLYEKFTAGNCPGMYRRFKEMADGGRDPVTGECSMVSVAYDVEAAPAFLVHPQDGKTSDAETRPVRSTAVR